MKTFATAFLSALLVAGFANAATLDVGTGTGTSADTPVFNLAPVSITQSLDTASLTAATMVHCGDPNTGYHTENSYGRRFQLFLDHSIVTQFTVLSVDYGVQLAFGDSFPDMPVDINLYTIPNGGALLFANLNLIGTATDALPGDGSADLTFRNLAVGGVVLDPIGDDLFVEIHTPDGQPTLDAMWPGGNSGGETAANYIAAVACGINEPTATGSIGFPDAHLFMIVNGDDDDTPPTPTVESNWSALKDLYR